MAEDAADRPWRPARPGSGGIAPQLRRSFLLSAVTEIEQLLTLSRDSGDMPAVTSALEDALVIARAELEADIARDP